MFRPGEVWQFLNILKTTAKLNQAICAIIFWGATFICAANDLDTIGVTLLRTMDSSLIGSGVNVAQAEGSVATNAWQVNPFAVGQPTNLFTYISSDGSAERSISGGGGEIY